MRTRLLAAVQSAPVIVDLRSRLPVNPRLARRLSRIRGSTIYLASGYLKSIRPANYPGYHRKGPGRAAGLDRADLR
jgi:hypothetical protein